MHQGAGTEGDAILLKFLRFSRPCFHSGVAPANQTKKGPKRKVSWISPIFCEFWCFSLRKRARFTLNLCSGMPLRKSSWTDLSLVWFAGATPDSCSRMSLFSLKTCTPPEGNPPEAPLELRKIFQRIFWSFIQRDLSGPVLHDTARLSQRYPPFARYGVFGVSTWPIGCDSPSPFSERFPLGEHAQWWCDTPPPMGYLSDTCAIP